MVTHMYNKVYETQTSLEKLFVFFLNFNYFVSNAQFVV